MLALERHRTLLQHLNSNGSLRTTEIAKELGVTEETVRRDFEKLEQAGVLKRSHGGAMAVDSSRLDFTRRVRAEQRKVKVQKLQPRPKPQTLTPKL